MNALRNINDYREGWLRRLAIACALLASAHEVSAAVVLQTGSNFVAMPFSITDHSSATGAAQITRVAAHTVTVTATGGAWTAYVRTLTPTFTFVPSTGDPNPNKPASDLAIRIPVLAATWIPLSSSNQVLVNVAGSQTATIDYRLNSNLATNPPGTYTISVIYTVTQP